MRHRDVTRARPSARTYPLLLALAALGQAACAPGEPDGGPGGGNDDLQSGGGAYAPLAFAPCDEDESLECATLTVPVDHGAPGGDKVDLAVVRAAATGPGKRLGVLFVNPGGPGGSGVDFVLFAQEGLARLRERFDVVSFDPRGVGRSRPVVCDFVPPAAPEGAGDDALAAFFDEAGRAFARGCLDRNGEFAARVGTTDVARDIDALRAALREPTISYLGFSYGTILGASYASLFPRRVRAMVLDGALPAEWLSDYLIEDKFEGAATSELVLQRIDQLCRADAACPLRDEGVVATLDRVAAELDASPAESDDGEVALDGFTLRNVAVNDFFFDEDEGWPAFVAALAGSARGDHGAFLDLLAEAKADEADENADGFGSSAFYAVACSDSATRRGAADYLPTFRAVDAKFPRFGAINPSNTTGFFSAPLEIPVACSAWPASRSAPLRTVRDAMKHPPVVIGNDFDHSTTLSWARSLAQALGSQDRLIRYQGGGHTAYNDGNPCIDDPVDAYLFDLTPPPAGLTCPARPVSFAPPAEAEASLAALGAGAPWRKPRPGVTKRRPARR